MTTTPAYTYRCTILEVVDGDTVNARIDVGFRIWAEVPLRLAGINAAEHGTVAGDAATAWVRTWVAGHPTVVVATFRAPEKYGRWLAIVTAADTGEVLNSQIVAAGHAVVWDGRGPKPV